MPFGLPDDKDEKILFAQILKHRGFEVKSWGRGNHEKGPRIITLILEKDDCKCKVSKKYYSLAKSTDSVYTYSENLECKKVKSQR
ncbi:MAG: hypothetical protein R2852_07415 [Bacteroidia bacterium]